MNYRIKTDENLAEIIRFRNWCHMHPELSNQEVETTKFIEAQLRAMGYEDIQTFWPHTGVCAMLHGGKTSESSRTVALRADIDALPTEEKTGLDYASQNKGVMHACGHDCHTAMLLGAAKLLMDTKDQICGNVKLIFQAAEETSHGAEFYIKEGVLDGVDAIMSQHVWGELDEPYVNFQAGPRMAAVGNFTIEVYGVSAHGTQPHNGVDALLAATAIVSNIQSLVSRSNNPLNPLVINIGEMHAGKRSNIIADYAVLKGTVRTYDKELRVSIEEKFRTIAENTAVAFGAKATLEYDHFANALYNDDDEVLAVAIEAAEKLFEKDTLKAMAPTMASEDFAYYADEIPAVFGFVGTRNKEKGFTEGNHSDKYMVSEEVLAKGAAIYAQFAADFLCQRANH